MKNKTIFDAVNEFKGCWSNVDHNQIKSEYIFIHSGEGSTWKRGELVGDVINHSPTVFNKLCTKEEFNALVEEMKLGLDVNPVTVNDYLSYLVNKTPLEPVELCFEIDSDKLADAFKKAEALDKKVSNTYTQEMHDKDEVTPIGCEVVLNLIKGAEGVTSDDLSHNGETMRVVALTQHKLPVLLNETNFFCYVCNNAHFKPLTPPVPLINGKAYQFECNGHKNVNGIYSKLDHSLYNHLGDSEVADCTNIQPLTLD